MVDYEAVRDLLLLNSNFIHRFFKGTGHSYDKVWWAVEDLNL